MAQDKPLRIAMFLGSVREGRMCLRVARFMQVQMESAHHTVDVFDPMEMSAPMLAKPLHHYSDRSQAPAWLVEADKKLKEADAVIVCSAEYNHSIPPALSSLMGHFPASSYMYKPSGIVCYSMGPFGGVRASMALRSLLGELGCISVSNIFPIPSVQACLDEAGNPTNNMLVPGYQRLLTQVEWHARAMRAYKQTHGLPS